MKLEFFTENYYSRPIFTNESRGKLNRCSINKIKRLYSKYQYLYDKYRETLHLLKTNGIILNNTQDAVIKKRLSKYHTLNYLLRMEYINRKWKK